MSGGRELPDVLAEVVSQFGRRIVDRPALLRAALSDTYGPSSGDHQEEVAAAVTASAVGVATAIRDADPAIPADRAQIQGWFDELVSAGLSLRNAALATSSWAAAFNAEGTARATSELSEQLLGGSASTGSSPTEGIARTDPRPAEPAARFDAPREAPLLLEGDDGVTVLGAESADDITEHASPLRPAERAPTAPPAYGPPTGPLVLPLEQEGTATDPRAGGPLGVLRNWWPAATAAVAVAAAAAICLPMIIANSAQEAPAEAAPIEESKAPTQFAKGDLPQFVLTADELTSVVPDGTVDDLWSPDEEYAYGYTSEDGTRWSLAGTPECQGVLGFIPPPSSGASSAAVIRDIYNDARVIYSVARAYESRGPALGAVSAMNVPASCGTLQVAMQGGTFPATLERLDDRLDQVYDRLDFGSFAILRRCVVEINVVACVYVSRLASVSAADDLGGKPIGEYLVDKAAAAEPFDPRGGVR